jgi:O-antigen/teichoic acid export membrane protein
MLVKMAEARRDGRLAELLEVWHDGLASLALLFFPLVGALLAVAQPLIVTLFTSAYAASVPIFVLFTASILLAPFMTDVVLRVYADMRFLALAGLGQLVLLVALVGPFLSAFGLRGAVLVTLLALAAARAVALARAAKLLGSGWRRVAPWGRLARLATAAAVAFPAAAWLAHRLGGAPLAAIAGGLATYLALYLAVVRAWGLAPPLALGRFSRFFRRSPERA